jgi:Protein of unknown function (DUF3089)
MSSKTLSIFIGILLLFGLSACDLFNVPSSYASTDHWLSLPDSANKSVDVFYLYPTVWAKINENDASICEIDNAMMLQNAPIAFSRQASLFDSLANIYAPFYQQADAAYTLSLSPSQQDSLIGGIPYISVKEAFRYYIKNLNDGRPFILAGHSQGSNLLLYLLSDYMKDHPKVYKRMIAAYAIGYSVTSNYLTDNPHLSFADSSNDIGVIISYNTEAVTIGVPGNPVVLNGALAINPINWCRNETRASALENLGSITWDSLGIISRVSNFADAYIDLSRGVVISTTPDPDLLSPGDAVFGRGVYHRYDYAFYYYDLRKNAADRVNAYFK